MKVILPFILLTLLCSCSSDPATAAPASPPTGNAALIRHPRAEATDSLTAATLAFETEIYNFGTVRAGHTVRHTFRFRNTGRYPLLITAARSSCGCTVAGYPGAPIPPGGDGEVTVSFDTTNKGGQQRKPIVLTANTLPATTTIFLEGSVSAK